MDIRLQTAANHWAVKRAADGSRWWMHPPIIRHINRLVCGEAIDGPHFGFNRLIKSKMPEGGFRRAVSVGCGSGGKEIRLLAENIVRTFDLFEISEARIEQGMEKARQQGVADRVTFHHADAFDQDFDGTFDLVYWNNSLHHMFDVKAALSWSHRGLQLGGYLAMDDFVGPTRFQWTDLELEVAFRIRDSLPERLLVDRKRPNRQLDRRLERPAFATMMAVDPTEAADSGNIVEALTDLFPQAEIIRTGGIVYHLGLNDVLSNFDEELDMPLLQSLLLLDEMLARNGHTQYAVAIACKD